MTGDEDGVGVDVEEDMSAGDVVERETERQRERERERESFMG